MKLRTLFSTIENIAATHGIGQVFLCGGAVRDKMLGVLDKLGDIDLTTGNAKVKNLAAEMTDELSKSYSIESKQMDDGHTTLYLANTHLDLSSNFLDPSVDSYLKSHGIPNPTDLQKEMFSRDFTCNAMLMDLELKKAYDPTMTGKKDIEAKFLRTCMEPEITLKSNLNRIIRVIYMAAKLNFTVDPKIISFIKENKELIRQIPPAYLTKTLDKAIDYNIDKVVELIDAMDLWKVLPITQPLYPYYAKRFIKTAQIRPNFDYGDNPYFRPELLKSPKKFRAWRKKILKKYRYDMLKTRQ